MMTGSAAPNPPAAPVASPPRPAPTEHTVLGRDESPVTFRGWLLGRATSRERAHTHRGEFAPPGYRCRRCRWFEVTIYRVDPAVPADPPWTAGEPPAYVVHTLGRSAVPEELTFARVAEAETAHKIMQLLVSYGRRGGDERTGPRLPEASARAIERAADADPELSAAYDAWLAAGVQ